jgi:toxin FitB
VSQETLKIFSNRCWIASVKSVELSWTFQLGTLRSGVLTSPDDRHRYQRCLGVDEAFPRPVRAGLDRGSSGGRLRTTSITVAEIRYGIERLPAGRRRDLLKLTADDLFSAFKEQILPFDAAAAAVYPLVVTQRERVGLPIDAFDAQIAAICLTQDALLATRTLKDFSDTGLDVVNPWHSN